MTDAGDFLATDEGAAAVLRAAGRRRTAKLTGAGSSSLAVVLGAVLVLTGGGAPSRDQLVPGESSPGPVASATATAVPSAGASTPPALGSTSPYEGPVDPVLGTPSPGATSAPPAQHRSTAKRVSPITRVTRDMDQTDLCDGDPNVAAYGYCTRAFDPGVVHRGHPVALGGEVCVPVTGRRATLRTDSTREVGITVSDSSGVLWQGGEGIRYSTPGPTITVEPGTCVGWTSPWDTRDREGFVVPPGTYDLTLGLSTGSGSTTWGGSVTVED